LQREFEERRVTDRRRLVPDGRLAATLVPLSKCLETAERDVQPGGQTSVLTHRCSIEFRPELTAVEVAGVMTRSVKATP
jgi:hypothetical protein